MVSFANDNLDAPQLTEIEYGPDSDPFSYARYPTTIANPGPMGLFSIGASAFILSMYNLHTREVFTPNVIVGMALWGGGITEFMAAMWEFPRGNTFGATAYACYGAFWLSYGTIFIPGAGIQAAFATEEEFHNAVGVYLMTWFFITLFFLAAVLSKRNIAFTILLMLLTVAFLLLAIAEFNPDPAIRKAGGVFQCCTALAALYIGVSELYSAEPVPLMKIPQGILLNV
ncbi:Gpr1 family protein [Marasmius fiardii PR-910]|nr:Gpr1 family protein [Marasmius fiardii PR-910]